MKLIFVFLITITIQLSSQQQEQQQSSNYKIIYITEKSGRTLRLDGFKKQSGSILWMYKRLYAVPYVNASTRQIRSELEQSESEQTISLNTEVQSDLESKFSVETTTTTSVNESNAYAINLRLTNLTYADSGVYKCVEWNSNNKLVYHLVVTSPISKPEITSDKSTMLVQEGSSLTLKCTSNFSYPYPTIKWFLNDKEVNSSLSVFKFLDKQRNSIQSELKLTNLTSEHHLSNYTCKLVQENEEQVWQTSDTTTLSIAYKPIVQIDIVNRQTTDKHLNLFDDTDVQFECKFKSNPTDKLKIEWKLNNLIQTNTNRVFNWLNRTNRRDLSVKKFNLTCLVTNSIGTGLSSYQITLIHEPIVKVEQTIYEVDELGQLKLVCNVESSPQAYQIEWRHYSNESSPESRLLSKSSHLELKSIKHTETNGYYVCSAQNEMTDSFGKRKTGSRQSEHVEVNVRFEPQMNLINRKLAVDLNQTRTQNLVCLTMANPQPEFTWFKNNVKLILSQSKYSFSSVIVRSKNVYENVLTINNLNELDLALYKCEASNQLGTNSLITNLVKLSKPDIPTELRPVYTDFMTLSLAWSASFDGGLSQSFQIKLNDTVYTSSIQSNLANLTNLNYDTLYAIRVKAENRLGSSDWSEPLLVRTHDLTEKSLGLLPIFNSLHLNVIKSQLEFELSPTRVKYCFKFKQDGYKTSIDCLPVSSNSLSLNNLVLVDQLNQTYPFVASQTKLFNVLVCFEAKSTLCLPEFNALIDNYKYDIKSASLAGQIPISLITAICVCILSLLAILFFSVLYCIRKRNFRMCKNLLDKSDESNQKKPVITTIEAPLSNKSFDLPSSSNNSTSDGYGSADSNLASSGTLLNTKRNLVSALSATASNIINNTLARNRQSEILVTEDDEQQMKTRQSKLMTNHEENSSTGVSNCSSLINNNNGAYIYSDLNYNDQLDSNSYNKGIITYVDALNMGTSSAASSGASNTDPIAINNSLSSNNSSVDSPTYGYNIAAATITNPAQQQQTINETDNLIYIKNGCLMIENFVHIDETNANYANATLLKQQQQQLSQQSRTNSYVVNSTTNQIDTPESGYSTPSRLKKVVYEVIV